MRLSGVGRIFVWGRIEGPKAPRKAGVRGWVDQFSPKF